MLRRVLRVRRGVVRLDGDDGTLAQWPGSETPAHGGPRVRGPQARLASDAGFRRSLPAVPFESALVVFALVLTRVSGLLLTGLWMFGSASIPPRVKALAAFSLALLVTPTQLSAAVPTPSTVLDLGYLAAVELAVGASLGLGLTVLLGGLQLAGDVADQQAGFSLGQVFNPQTGDMTTPTGQLLTAVVTAALLAAEPFGVEERVVAGVLDTFEAMPPGRAAVSPAVVQTISDLVGQSLVLAVKVAAPLIAAAGLVSVALGFLGHSVPQVNVLVLGLAVRAAVSLLLLAVSMGPAGEVGLEMGLAAVDAVANALQPGG